MSTVSCKYSLKMSVLVDMNPERWVNLYETVMNRLKLLCVVLYSASNVFVLWSCSTAGPVGINPEKIKMFICTEFSVLCCYFKDTLMGFDNFKIK